MRNEILIFAFALLLPSGFTAQVIDQQNVVDTTVMPSYVTMTSGGQGHVQTFTAGLNGTLVRVDLMLSNQDTFGGIFVEIHPIDASGLIDWTTYLYYGTNVNAPVPSSPTWVPIDLTIPTQPNALPPIVLQAGDRVALVVSADVLPPWIGANHTKRWYRNPDAASYPDGALDAGGDAGFRTWMKPADVTVSRSFVEHFDLNPPAPWTSSGDWINRSVGGAIDNGPCMELSSPTVGITTRTLTSPSLNFAFAPQDAVMVFRYRITEELTTGLQHQIGFEIDRNDGQGFVPIPGTQFSAVTGWTTVSVPLTNVGGRPEVRIRAVGLAQTVPFVFSINSFARVFIDEIEIRPTPLTVTPAMLWSDDFETLHDWNAVGSTWQQGVPTQGALALGHDGGQAWATGLNIDYAPNLNAALRSPYLALQGFGPKVVLEYAISTDLASGDQFRLEIDRMDGMGWQVVPGTTVTGSTNGRRFRSVDLPLSGGSGQLQLSFVLVSDASNQSAGVLIDDVRIHQPTYPGSASLAGDDLSMEISIDGVREYGFADAYTMNPGEYLSVYTHSGGGTLDGGAYYLIGEVFTGSASFVKVAGDLWFSLGNGTFLLDGGAEAPFYLQTLLSPYGETMSLGYGGGFVGWKCMLQAVVVKPGSVHNGFYASSDAFLIEFN